MFYYILKEISTVGNDEYMLLTEPLKGWYVEEFALTVVVGAKVNTYVDVEWCLPMVVREGAVALL